MAYELKQQDLAALLIGGAFFGSGGGGTIESARHLASHFQKGDYYPADTVRVVSVDEAAAAQEGEAVMVAYLGAPEAINTAQYPLGPVTAAQKIQARLVEQGRKLAYVAPPESGALGFVVACLVAAKLGIAVLDADGAGRAVPSLPMLTYAAQKIDPRPAFLVSQSGLCVELDVTPRAGSHGDAGHQRDVSAIVEQMMRPVVSDPDFEQYGGLAMWVMQPSQLQRALPVRGTLTRALELGRAVNSGDIASAAQMSRYLADRCGITAHTLVAQGEFKSASVNTAGGFDVGQIVIHAGSADFTVLYQNESLMVWDSRRPAPVLLAPDSVAYFVEGSGESVFTNGDLVTQKGTLNPAVTGRKVTLLAWEAEPALRVPGGLIVTSFLEALASPLGYLGPYVPVGALQKLTEGGVA
ncbi:DUF917 domain-containing protein [Paraburkholderia jirisanensis]